VDERMSDMSFSLNINEIIGSFDENNSNTNKSELIKIKEEIQQKDECIQELLKKIESLDKVVN